MSIITEVILHQEFKNASITLRTHTTHILAHLIQFLLPNFAHYSLALVLDGEMQAWMDAEDSLEVW